MTNTDIYTKIMMLHMMWNTNKIQ